MVAKAAKYVRNNKYYKNALNANSKKKRKDELWRVYI